MLQEQSYTKWDPWPFGHKWADRAVGCLTICIVSLPTHPPSTAYPFPKTWTEEEAERSERPRCPKMARWEIPRAQDGFQNE
eukprot:3594236-Pyramimonas_sp.AAC.1